LSRGALLRLSSKLLNLDEVKAAPAQMDNLELWGENLVYDESAWQLILDIIPTSSLV